MKGWSASAAISRAFHTLANEEQIFGDGTLIAIHPVLDGAGSGGLRWAIARCAYRLSTARGISSKAAHLHLVHIEGI